MRKPEAALKHKPVLSGKHSLSHFQLTLSELSSVFAAPDSEDESPKPRTVTVGPGARQVLCPQQPGLGEWQFRNSPSGGHVTF